MIMTPREALYHICVALGPIPVTERDDNLSPEQIRIKEAVCVLQNLIQPKEPNNDAT